MTRPARSSLVLDGDTLKARLMADRSSGPSAVHVDWLRFTVLVRQAPLDLDLLFPKTIIGKDYWEVQNQLNRRQIKALQAEDYQNPGLQALSLANEVAAILGPDFTVSDTTEKGHDFYHRRWPIYYNDTECGWIGFGASDTSPRQARQAQTIHCNLYGLACTFARPGWRQQMAQKIDEWNANITRIDLALDFFDGKPGGLDGVIDGYKAGEWDNRGQRPKCSGAGDWVNKRARSFYVGSREAGKQTNVYEKGHQMYGDESGNPWIRYELRLGNKLRDLPSETLTDPDAFFAGGSPALAQALELAKTDVQPQAVPVRERLQSETGVAPIWRTP